MRNACSTPSNLHPRNPAHVEVQSTTTCEGYGYLVPTVQLQLQHSTMLLGSGEVETVVNLYWPLIRRGTICDTQNCGLLESALIFEFYSKEVILKWCRVRCEKNTRDLLLYSHTQDELRSSCYRGTSGSFWTKWLQWPMRSALMGIWALLTTGKKSR